MQFTREPILCLRIAEGVETVHKEIRPFNLSTAPNCFVMEDVLSSILNRFFIGGLACGLGVSILLNHLRARGPAASSVKLEKSKRNVDDNPNVISISILGKSWFNPVDFYTG